LVYEKRMEIRWSDLDPNFHLRHSVYFDLGAFCRISYLNENGITPQVMLDHNIGPVIFREECVFKKEIKVGDELKVNLQLDKATEDFSKWTMIHELWKNENVLAAVITADCAWMDTKLRKIAKPLEIFRDAFDRIPRTESFQFLERKLL